MEHFQVPFMADALKSSIATFHTTKITVPDPTNFLFVGSIPKSMYMCVSAESKVMADYRNLPPTGPRQLTPEMQTALDAVDTLAKRGKKPDTKKQEKEGQSSQAATPKKHKVEHAATSPRKKRKVKKMAKKPKTTSPSDSDYVPSDHDHCKSAKGNDVHLEGSPRGDTPPHSPSLEVPLNDSIPIPPPSTPSHTTTPISIAPL
ncbi:unnamed protein product [Lactuca saligna]|uniref:Uncharacterized protein n=1 Tax=Lactuca saligna TaxID=75948 RepID=A0AA36A4A1_LACSI|nr:unnamed protein product [Lactuca saligna]